MSDLPENDRLKRGGRVWLSPLTNLSKIPNLHGQKHLTPEICQRKFARVKGASILQ